MKHLLRPLFLATISLLFVSQLKAQTNYFDSLRVYYDTNFFVLCEKVDSFYSANQELIDSAKGGYKSYQRFKNFWMPRIDSNGRYSSYIEDYYLTGKNIDSLINLSSSASSKTGTVSDWCIDNFIPSWKQLGYSKLPQQNASSPTDSKGMGYSSCIWANPDNEDVLYAGANNGGLWKSTNFKTSNPTWNNITLDQIFGLGVQCIAVNPHLSQKNEIMISVSMADWVGNGIYKSTDYGYTWNCVKIDEGFGLECQQYYVRKIVYHPTNSSIVYAIQGQRFMISTNGGNSFITVRFPHFFDPTVDDFDWIDLEVHINSSTSAPRIIITGSKGDAVFYSDNGGASFYRVITPSTMYKYPQPGAYLTTSIEYFEPLYAVSETFKQYVYRCYKVRHKYMVGTNEEEKYKYILEKSTDNGFSWSVAFESVGAFYTDYHEGYRKACLEISKINPNIVFVGGIKPFVFNTSTTPTTTLKMATSLQIHNDIRGMSIVKVPEVLPTLPYREWIYMATDGGVARVEYNHTLGTATPLDINGEGLAIQQTYQGALAYDDGVPILIQGLQDNGNTISSMTSGDLLYNYESNVETITDVNMDIGDGGGLAIPSKKSPQYFAYSGWGRGAVYERSTRKRRLLGWMNYNQSLIYNEQTKKIYFFETNTTNEIVTVDDPFNPTIYNSYTGFYTRNRLTNFIVNREGPSVHRMALSSDGKRFIFTYYGGADNQGNRLYITSNADESNINSIVWTPITNSNLPLSVQIESILINPKNKDDIWLTFGYSSGRVANNIGSVYYSADGGNSWTDISNGLGDWNKNLGVGRVILDEATADADGIKQLYAATDYGVYYRNDLTSEWIRFSDGLPYAIASDILIDQENRKLLATTYGRGSWYTDLPCCTEVNISDITIHSVNETWEGDKTFYSDIIVPNGKSLTLKNGNFSFNACGILVETGGSLFVENSVLQSGCKSFWSGITVNGNPTGATGFAKLEGSTLRDAYRGVVVGDLVNSSTNAGAFHAYGSKFINNRVSIFFKEGTRTSVVSDCDFLCTRPLIDNSGKGSLQFISLFGNDNGATIRSCRFKNTYPYPFPGDSYRGTGIISIDASYTLDVNSSNATQNPPPACLNFDGTKNNFQGLSDAVSVYNLNSMINTRVNLLSGNYHNNVVGIKIFGNGKKVVNRNFFDWDGDYVDPNPLNNSWEDSIYGIKLTNSPTNHIDSNSIYFQPTFSQSTLYNGIGIKADYTNDQNNKKSYIYLTDIEKGGSSATPNIFGLELFNNNPTLDISCSKFINLTKDWHINVSSGQSFASPQPQSTSSMLFSNQFSNCWTSVMTKNIESNYAVTVRFLTGGMASICVDNPVTAVRYSSSNPNHILKTCNETHPCVLREYEDFEPGTPDYTPPGPGGDEGYIKKPSHEKDFEGIYGAIQTGKISKSTIIEFQGDDNEKDFLAVLYNLRESGRTYSQLTEEEIRFLKELYNTSTSVRLDNYLLAILQMFSDESLQQKQNNVYVSSQNEATSHVSFLLIPNPASDEFKIKLKPEFKAVSSNYTVTVYSLLGVEMYQGVLNSERGEIAVTTKNWSPSIYTVRISDGKAEYYTEKVVILH